MAPPAERAFLHLDGPQATLSLDAAAGESLIEWRKSDPARVDFHIAGQFHLRADIRRLMEAFDEKLAEQTRLMKERMREALERGKPSPVGEQAVSSAQSELDFALALLRQVDGIYDEHGQYGHGLNLCGLLGLRKPIVMWTRDVGDKQGAEFVANPDAYLQRHLYMGSYLTEPFPGNDHTILPVDWAEKYYMDYGPLFDAISGKKWVLQPHVIEVQGQKAKANLFEVPGGYVIPVTFGGEQASVKVFLRRLPKLAGQKTFRIEAINPGSNRWVSVKATEDGELLTLDVPLRRGCAMVKLAHTWIKPQNHYFVTPITLEMGTVIEGTKIHYTLDGSEPTIRSPLYSAPLPLEKTTTVKMAVFKPKFFRRGTMVGSVITANFVKVPPSS